MATKLDATWQMGLALGILLTVLTILGVWYAARQDSTIGLGLPILGYIAVLAWLEKGVTK